MLENLSLAAQITLVGMGLVFAAIVLLWVVMAALVHLAKGQEVFDGIGDIRPDIIVLDIMLPDVDGWDLLTRLSEHPETRGIPVIVCSVVSDPDLTRALGARASLSKPVQRQEFIRSLDQVSSRA